MFPGGFCSAAAPGMSVRWRRCSQKSGVAPAQPLPPTPSPPGGGGTAGVRVPRRCSRNVIPSRPPGSWQPPRRGARAKEGLRLLRSSNSEAAPEVKPAPSGAHLRGREERLVSAPPKSIEPAWLLCGQSCARFWSFYPRCLQGPGVCVK